jgi:hypothetical protein
VSKHKHHRLHTKGRSKGVRMPARVRKVKRKLRRMLGR